MKIINPEYLLDEDRVTVTCKSCKTSIWKHTFVPCPGDLISAANFEGINEFPSPKEHSPIKCPSCGAYFDSRNGGWVHISDATQVTPQEAHQ